MTDPIYFTSPEEFGDWLARHHADTDEVLVGYWKKHTGRPSLTWAQAVRQALRFGWIDGQVKRLDGDRHQQRFTPRRRSSIWSNVNVRIVGELIEEGLMSPAGLAAFEARTPERTGVYAFEVEAPTELTVAAEARLRADPAVLAFWLTQPAGYRSTALHWVTSAKRDETRQRRLETLVEDCRAGLRIKQLRR